MGGLACASSVSGGAALLRDTRQGGGISSLEGVASRRWVVGGGL